MPIEVVISSQTRANEVSKHKNKMQMRFISTRSRANYVAKRKNNDK